MSTTGDDDYEHWPSDNKHYASSTAPSSGYGSMNGRQHFTYIAAKAKSATPEPTRKDSKSPSPVPEAPVVNYPQPVYYAQIPHMNAHPGAQYSSHPVPAYAAPQGYYASYGHPSPAPTPASAPAPAPAMPSSGHNMHMYIPSYSEPKPAPAPEGPKPNAWLGRTKAQVEEDNMKIAKNEDVYAPHKSKPVGLKHDQLCWVVELDGTRTLRMFVDIEEMTGTWKTDPRFPDSWYFIREEEQRD